MERSHFLLLTLGLLLLAAGLLVGGLALSPAQASSQTPCEAVTDVALTYTPTLVYTDTPVLFTAEVLTGSLPLTYTWDFDDGTVTDALTTTAAIFTVTHQYTTGGIFSVTLTTWNTCTLTPLTSTVRITVTARPCVTPTGLTLTYTPTQVYAHTEALFTGKVITGALPLTYTWLFGDGTSPVTGTSTTPSFTATHTYTAAQVYTVSLAAWNVCTVTPTQEAITLTVAPCNVISDVLATYWPTSAHVGQVLTFTANVSGGSPPWTFEWAFGDGQTAMGQVVTHVYAAPLSYTVSLTAGNPCHRRTTTTTVHIEPLRQVFLPVGFRAFGRPGHLGYGANVAAADHVSYLAEMGFDWAKGFVTWSRSDGGPAYNFADVDNQLREFLPHAPNVLLRIHGNSPPVSADDLAKFQAYAQALAAHVSTNWRYQGLKTIAFEIWNEPNLDYEWGGPPNAAQYTAALKAGYEGIKAGDPQAIVVSAGLATTGGSLTDSPAERARVVAQARQLYGAIQVTPDLTFLRNMYKNGAKGHFDALGSHPYGGSYAPDTPPDQVTMPIYFRRAEEQRQVMLDHGDDSPLWNTEFGWVLETSCDLGEHEWMEVSEAKQAEYLAAAYAYAEENWPWMGPMFLFNLDFATVSWYAHCDPMRWYSITYRENPQDPGNSPILTHQAFGALRDMPKNSGW